MLLNGQTNNNFININDLTWFHIPISSFFKISLELTEFQYISLTPNFSKHVAQATQSNNWHFRPYGCESTISAVLKKSLTIWNPDNSVVIYQEFNDRPI